MFTNCFSKTKTYRSRLLPGVDDRQSKILGFSQAKLSDAVILCAGAGGLGTTIGQALARKGVGHLFLADRDTVEPSNLNRQLFYKRDLWRNKAVRSAKNLARESFLGTTFTGVPANAMEALRSGLVPRVDCIVSSVDNDLTREELSDYALASGLPLITVAVSGDGDGGYVHVQKPGESCWGCAFPRGRRIRDDLDSYRAPCPGTPAIKDILMVVSGIAVYAIDTLFMERPVAWNYCDFHMAGYMPGAATRIERLPGCHLCGGIT